MFSVDPGPSTLELRTAEMTWTRRHLLDLQSLTAEELTVILDTARSFKAINGRSIKRVPPLRGKTVVNLFVEPSTRTRISFELAAVRLSADVINFSAEASSLKKGETLRDTIRNLEALNADIIILRHSASERPTTSPASPAPTSSTPATAPTSIRPKACSTPSPSASARAASPG